ncbi:MAG: hypothetical protein FJ095_17725 [Deltaproteobacteria bacterium]|nr:hypothetical protein [Deltaproteobacteria bacterium]
MPARRPRLLCTLAFVLALYAPRDASAQANQVDEEASIGDDDDDRPPPPSVPPSVVVGVGIGSMWLTDRAGLADAARRLALGELGRFAVLLEPRAAIHLERFVLPLRLRYATTTSDGEIALTTLGGMAGAGYVVLSRPDVLLYPSASVGVLRNELRLGSSRVASGPLTFDKLASATGPATLESVTVVVEAAMDASYRVVGRGSEARGLYVGARVGLTAAVSHTPWSLDHQDVANLASPGPTAPTSGPAFSITIAGKY